MKNLGFKWPPANSSLSLFKKNNIHTFSFFFTWVCWVCSFQGKRRDKNKKEQVEFTTWHSLFSVKTQTVVIETIDHSFVYHISRDKSIIINTQYLGMYVEM